MNETERKAASELLAACRDAETLIVWARSYLADPQRGKGFNEVLGALRAAITAAEGGAR